VIGFLLDARPPAEAAQHKGRSTLQKWASVDWVGTVLSLGIVVPLLLALQWGGNQYAWDDKIIVACFCIVRIFLC
jgi:formate-dependent nitrite reductase membrane component NrfD